MHYTLIYPIREVAGRTEVLLGYMLSGTWEGYFNGFGGKVEKESSVNSAMRELREEAGIKTTLQSDIWYKGWVLFQEENIKDTGIRVDVFSVKLEDTVTPKATDVALPCWFDSEQLPFAKMPAFDDQWVQETVFTKKWHFRENTINYRHVDNKLLGVTSKKRIASSRL